MSRSKHAIWRDNFISTGLMLFICTIGRSTRARVQFSTECNQLDLGATAGFVRSCLRG